MILAIFTVLLVGQQAEPHPYSAQCLTEVAALTSENFDMRDDRLRGAAVAKTAQLMAASRDLVAAVVQVDAAQVASLADVERQEAAGTLPAGSLDVTRARFARQRAEYVDQAGQLRRLAPSCDWPAITAAAG